MKNQWLLRRNVEIDWDNLTGDLRKRLEHIFFVAHRYRVLLGGGVLFVGPKIYDQLVATSPSYNLAFGSVVAAGEGLGNMIRIVYNQAGSKVYKDIKILNFPKV